VTSRRTSLPWLLGVPLRTLRPPGPGIGRQGTLSIDALTALTLPQSVLFRADTVIDTSPMA
jgi:hypothetical protein